MIAIFRDFKQFFIECKSQDFAFYMAAFYLIFSYLRPHVIYPALNIMPWTQISIIAGMVYLIKNQRIKIQSTHVLAFLFVLVAIASSFTSQYPDLSFSKLDAIYVWVIEMIFFTNCIKNTHQFKLLTILFFLILFKMSLFGAKTWALRGLGFTNWGIAGPAGYFANSGEYSLLMGILAVASLAFILAHKKANKLYYILPISATMAVLGASSRGGQLAIVAGLLTIAIVIGKLKLKNILFVALTAFVIYSVIPEEQKSRFSTAGEDDTSNTRLIYWEKGIEMMQSYPLLGVGYYTFPQYFSDHYSYEFSDDAYMASRKEVAHNSFIQVGSTMGYTGLMCYIFMIILCFKQNRKTRKLLRSDNIIPSKEWRYRYSTGLDAAMITYLVGSLFMSVAFYPYIYLLMMFSQALLNSTSNEETLSLAKGKK